MCEDMANKVAIDDLDAPASRKPSTRPIDQRWDRSRGIVFPQASKRPSASPSFTWSPTNGIVFAQISGSRHDFTTRPKGLSGPGSTRRAGLMSNPQLAFSGDMGAIPIPKPAKAAGQQKELGKGSRSTKGMSLRQTIGTSPRPVNGTSAFRRSQVDVDKLLMRHQVDLEQIMQERDTFKKERDTFRKERDNLKKQEDNVNRERDQVNAERADLKKEQERVRVEAQKELEIVRTEAQKHLGSARAENQLLADQKRYLKKHNADLEEQNTALASRAESAEQRAREKVKIDEDAASTARSEAEQQRSSAMAQRLEAERERKDQDRVVEQRVGHFIQEQRVFYLKLREELERNFKESEGANTHRFNDHTTSSKDAAHLRHEGRADYVAYHVLWDDLKTYRRQHLVQFKVYLAGLSRKASIRQKTFDGTKIHAQFPVKYKHLNESLRDFTQAKVENATRLQASLNEMDTRLVKIIEDLGKDSHFSRSLTRLHVAGQGVNNGFLSALVHTLQELYPWAEMRRELFREVDRLKFELKMARGHGGALPSELRKKYMSREIAAAFFRWRLKISDHAALEAMLQDSPVEKEVFVKTKETRDLLQHLDYLASIYAGTTQAQRKAWEVFQKRSGEVKEGLRQKQDLIRRRFILEDHIHKTRHTEEENDHIIRGYMDAAQKRIADAHQSYEDLIGRALGSRQRRRSDAQAGEQALRKQGMGGRKAAILTHLARKAKRDGEEQVVALTSKTLAEKALFLRDATIAGEAAKRTGGEGLPDPSSQADRSPTTEATFPSEKGSQDTFKPIPLLSVSSAKGSQDTFKPIPLLSVSNATRRRLERRARPRKLFERGQAADGAEMRNPTDQVVMASYESKSQSDGEKSEQENKQKTAEESPPLETPSASKMPPASKAASASIKPYATAEASATEESPAMEEALAAKEVTATNELSAARAWSSTTHPENARPLRKAAMSGGETGGEEVPDPRSEQTVNIKADPSRADVRMSRSLHFNRPQGENEATRTATVVDAGEESSLRPTQGQMRSMGSFVVRPVFTNFVVRPVFTTTPPKHAPRPYWPDLSPRNNVVSNGDAFPDSSAAPSCSDTSDASARGQERLDTSGSHSSSDDAAENAPPCSVNDDSSASLDTQASPSSSLDDTEDFHAGGDTGEVLISSPSSPEMTVQPFEVDAAATSPHDIKSKDTQAAIKQSAECENEGQESNDLTFNISAEDRRNALMASRSTNAAYWSHRLYKNSRGEVPSVRYCTSFDTAETQAQAFLNETVLGFDMEWENRGKNELKANVALIQIAAESRICLFHLALFKGHTVAELVPPSLRVILESRAITKAGVNIQGDAKRLMTFLELEAVGLVELSHLYKVVTYSEKSPSQVNKKLVSLADQVQNVLLLPLLKGDVRTSAWSRTRLSREQSDYAASDAYAGFRLYHALEQKRKAMSPAPPRPAFYEEMQPLILGDGSSPPQSTKVQRKKKSEPVGDSVKAADDGEDDGEEFFDAQETLDPYQLGDQQDPSQVADAEQSGSDVAYPSLETQPAEDLAQDPIDADPQVTSTTSTRDPSATSPSPIKTAKEQRLPPSAEVDRADQWTQTWISSLPTEFNRTAKPKDLRAYHLWHQQGFDCKQVAALLRDPPLAMSTVASYVMEALKEDLPYDVKRVREPLGFLPTSVVRRYQKIVDRVNGAR